MGVQFLQKEICSLNAINQVFLAGMDKSGEVTGPVAHGISGYACVFLKWKCVLNGVSGTRNGRGTM